MPIDDVTEQAEAGRRGADEDRGMQNSLKVYELFRDRIKHQDILISHRVTFFLAMQAAIGAALKSWPSQKVGQVPGPDDWITYWFLPAMGWMLAVGLLISIYFAYYGIEACMQQYSNLERCQSAKLHNISMIALPPRLYGKGCLDLAALPPLRSSWVGHLFGHWVIWALTFLSLCYWPCVLSHKSFEDLAAGNVNAWFFVLLVGGLIAYVLLLLRHAYRCFENDRLL